MSIPRAQEDPWTREMAKFEARPVMINGTYIEPIPMARGGRKDFPFLAYPRMLYKAESANGGPRICDTTTADDEAQERMKVGQGWSTSQEGALALVESNQLELARLAANRTYNEQWMSGRAKAEAAAVDETTMNHLGEIPETPIVRRQRRKPGPKPRKQTAAAVEG